MKPIGMEKVVILVEDISEACNRTRGKMRDAMIARQVYINIWQRLEAQLVEEL